jgi:hypothetical protein
LNVIYTWPSPPRWEDCLFREEGACGSEPALALTENTGAQGAAKVAGYCQPIFDGLDDM